MDADPERSFSNQGWTRMDTDGKEKMNRRKRRERRTEPLMDANQEASMITEQNQGGCNSRLLPCELDGFAPKTGVIFVLCQKVLQLCGRGGQNLQPSLLFLVFNVDFFVLQ